MSKQPSWTECNRKAAVYGSEEAAEADADATALRFGRPIGSMAAYRCERCGRWKVGTSRGLKLRRHERHYGPFDLTLWLTIGGRAYGHGRFENGHPPEFMRWLTVRVPEIVEKRRRRAAA